MKPVHDYFPACPAYPGGCASAVMFNPLVPRAPLVATITYGTGGDEPPKVRLNLVGYADFFAGTEALDALSTFAAYVNILAHEGAEHARETATRVFHMQLPRLLLGQPLNHDLAS